MSDTYTSAAYYALIDPKIYSPIGPQNKEIATQLMRRCNARMETIVKILLDDALLKLVATLLAELEDKGAG